MGFCQSSRAENGHYRPARRLWLKRKLLRNCTALDQPVAFDLTRDYIGFDLHALLS